MGRGGNSPLRCTATASSFIAPPQQVHPDLRVDQTLQRSAQSFPALVSKEGQQSYLHASTFQTVPTSSYQPVLSPSTTSFSPEIRGETDYRLVGAIRIGDALFYGTRRCTVLAIHHEAQPPNALIRVNDTFQEATVALEHLSRVPQSVGCSASSPTSAARMLQQEFRSP